MRDTLKNAIWILAFLIPVSLFSETTNCGFQYTGRETGLKIEGNWKIATGDNPNWKSPDYDDSTWRTTQLPDFQTASQTEVYGFQWYRCNFFVSDSGLDQDTFHILYLGEIRDADEAFLNGYPIGSTGKFPPSTDIDFHKTRAYPIPVQYIQPGKNTIAIRVYSTAKQHGINRIPELRPEAELMWSLAGKQIFQIASGYIFILIAAYFLIGSFVRKIHLESLFFSLFSAGLGLYMLIRTDYRYRLFDDFSISYQAELLVLILLPVLFCNFLTFFTKEKRSIPLYVYEGAMGLLFLFTLFMKGSASWLLIINIFNLSLPFALAYCLYIGWKGYKKEQVQMQYVFWGMICLVPGVVVDSMSAVGVWNLPNTVYISFLIFLILISIQLSEQMVKSLQESIEQESELIHMEKVKTDFLFDVSQEFKTYTDTLTDSLEGLRKPRISAANRKKFATSIEQSIDSTLTMIRDVVLLNQLEARQLRVSPESFSLEQSITECIQKVETSVGFKKRSKSFDIVGGDFDVVLPKELFQQMCTQIIENAYKFTKKTDELQILVHPEGNQMRISFFDDGPGISQEDQKYLLNKFIRGTSHSDYIPGHGIGLSIAKEGAEFLGGSLSMESNFGMGSKFTIVLPIRWEVRKG